MILIDTSVWADHFRSSDHRVVALVAQGAILQHPLVTGELAMGNLRDWSLAITRLQSLDQADHLAPSAVLDFIQAHRLMGTGLGFIDAHLLASASATRGAELWTRDKRLHVQAERLGVAFSG